MLKAEKVLWEMARVRVWRAPRRQSGEWKKMRWGEAERRSLR